MPKYIRIACFTHSFTVHLPSAGDATRKRPLSTSSITAFTASVYFFSFNNSRLPQASRIKSCISLIFCKHTVQIIKKTSVFARALTSCNLLLFLSLLHPKAMRNLFCSLFFLFLVFFSNYLPAQDNYLDQPIGWGSSQVELHTF